MKGQKQTLLEGKTQIQTSKRHKSDFECDFAEVIDSTQLEAIIGSGTFSNVYKFTIENKNFAFK